MTCLMQHGRCLETLALHPPKTNSSHSRRAAHVPSLLSAASDPGLPTRLTPDAELELKAVRPDAQQDCTGARCVRKPGQLAM